MERKSADNKQSKVVVFPHDKIVARQNLIQFIYPNRSANKPEQDEAQIRRDLFLQGFGTLKHKHLEDPRSFYQIAGIHGLPWEPYDGITNDPEEKFSGYCEHGSILFPTWHRPYMLLIEQEIISCAQKFIDDYQPRDGGKPLTNVQKESYKKLAKDIRLPYWDWADSYSQCLGLPACLTDEHLTVEYPQKASIHNPLRCYVLPVHLFSHDVNYCCSPETIPQAKPYYAPKLVDVPQTPEFYPTIRHPTPEYKSNDLELKLELMKQCNILYRPAVYGMFKESRWAQFSNHFDDHDSDSSDKFLRHSLEFVHDNVHVNVGGYAGHMAYPDVASFDPIFFLHHANVDRLCALWQIIHPEDDPSWMKPSASREGTFVIKPGQIQDENSPLYPFLKTQPKGKPRSKDFWTSKDVRYVTYLGYTYPEIEQLGIVNVAKVSEEQKKWMLHEMLKMYHPAKLVESRFYLKISGVDKYASSSTYYLQIFVGCTAEDVLDGSYTMKDPQFAVRVAIFSRGKINRCGRCHDNAEQGKRMTFSVDITTTVVTLGLNTDGLPKGFYLSEGAQLTNESTKTSAGERRRSTADDEQIELTPSFSVAVVAEMAKGRLQILSGITTKVFIVDQDFHEFRESGPITDPE